LRRAYLIETRKLLVILATAAALLLTSGCRLRRETRIQPSQLPPPAREASLAELVANLNARSQSIHTMSATVDLEPTAGSIYSGVIKEYHDIRGFIMMEEPAMIRMLGQAPVVRTNVFDMVSDGKDFRLYIPPKQKFIVGKTTFRRPAKNSLENLRPQHILEALLVPAFDPSHEKCFLEEAEEGGSRFYVIGVVESSESGELRLICKAWFDRANLDLARMQFYESEGLYVEDVHYSDYQGFQGVTYPTHIEVARPIEDYRLAITILKAVFNQPIDADKFILAQPSGTQLVDLNAKSPQEKPSGQ
jgi:outer membrane lipoprotein-sorting protein